MIFSLSSLTKSYIYNQIQVTATYRGVIATAIKVVLCLCIRKVSVEIFMLMQIKCFGFVGGMFRDEKKKSNDPN